VTTNVLPRAAGSGTPEVPWFLRSGGRLFVTLVLVLAVPFAAFSLDVMLRARNTLEVEAIESNSTAATLGAFVVEAHMEGLVRFVESYARRPELAAALEVRDGRAVRSHLEEVVRNQKSLGRVFVTDADGVELYDWPLDPDVIGQSFAHRDWYRGVVRRREAYVSEIYVRQAAPRIQVVAIAVPIGGGVGPPLGYLVAQYPVSLLSERLAGIRPTGAGAIRLFDQNDHVAAASAGPAAEPVDLTEQLGPILAGGGDWRFEVDPVSGIPSLLSWSRIGSTGWLVMAQWPKKAVYAPALAFEESIGIVSVLCLAGLLGLGFVWMNVVRRHHMALLELQRQKDLLSEMLVHDLRSPLAATLGSIDLLRSHAGELGPSAQEDVTRAAHSAERARDLLNRLLDIMRMEEGVLSVSAERRDLVDLVRAKVDEFQPLAGAGGLTLGATVPATPLEADVDPGLLGRVLDNLITNALRHTRRGGRIEVSLASEDGGERASLTVADTGVGIAPEALPHLFRKFPAAGSPDRPPEPGLGLVFCRMAIELHGGSIDARSRPGEGAAFRVRLPRTRPATGGDPQGAR
jgi:signal transduction histidine kinase